MRSELEHARHFILALQDQAIPPTDLESDPADKIAQSLRAEGLIDVFDDSHRDEPSHPIISLTASGQIFSERIRDESAWRDTLASIEAEHAPVTLCELKRRLLADEEKEPPR